MLLIYQLSNRISNPQWTITVIPTGTLNQYEVIGFDTTLPINWHRPTLFSGCITHHLPTVANARIIPFTNGWDLERIHTKLYPVEEVLIRENYNDAVYVLSIGF